MMDLNTETKEDDNAAGKDDEGVEQIDDQCHECTEPGGRHYSTPEVSEEIRNQLEFEWSNNNTPNVIKENRSNNGEDAVEHEKTKKELEEVLKLVQTMEQERAVERKNFEELKVAWSKERSENEELKVDVRALEDAKVAAEKTQSELSIELQDLRAKVVGKDNSVLSIAKEIDRSELTMEIDMLKTDMEVLQSKLDREKALVLQMEESNAALNLRILQLNDEKLKEENEKKLLQIELQQLRSDNKGTSDLGGQTATEGAKQLRTHKTPIKIGRGRRSGRGRGRGRGRSMAAEAETPPSMIARLKKKERNETKTADSDFDYEWGDKESTGQEKALAAGKKRRATSKQADPIDVEDVPEYVAKKKAKAMPPKSKENKFILPEDKRKMLMIYEIGTNE